ncbi:MAG: hypothetical protein PHN42_01065 [Bacilli bacterium]|nr:hypothetical protein [Bacilli bacterium]
MKTYEEYNIAKIIKTLTIIIIIILIFYGITILLTQNKTTKKENNLSTEIQYDEILIGSIYNQNQDEYYVLVQLTDDYSALYETSYNYQQNNDIKLYTATLDNTMNKKYYGDVSNFENKFPTFKQSTLIKIKNDTIVEHYEGVTEILKILGE